jgi:cytochrome c
MRRLSFTLIICTVVSMVSVFAYNLSVAADKEQLVGFVKKAAAFYKQNGMEKSFEEYSNPKGRFIEGELYIYAYDMKGTCVAHGANPKLIGQDLYEIQDVDGKYLIKELVKAAKNGSGFVEYKWKNPKTGEIEQKLGYVEKLDENYFAGSGIYFGAPRK